MSLHGDGKDGEINHTGRGEAIERDSTLEVLNMRRGCKSDATTVAETNNTSRTTKLPADEFASDINILHGTHVSTIVHGLRLASRKIGDDTSDTEVMGDLDTKVSNLVVHSEVVLEQNDSAVRIERSREGLTVFHASETRFHDNGIEEGTIGTLEVGILREEPQILTKLGAAVIVTLAGGGSEVSDSSRGGPGD
jgi:hypothetical protein